MGSCLGRGTGNIAAVASRQNKDTEEVVLTKVITDKQDVDFLAEVYAVSCDEGPLRWQSVFQCTVPVSLSCIKWGPVYSYRLSATGDDGTTFNTCVHVPGTNFRKTSACFVQWREMDGDGGWGLNFVSESDAAKFLDECSPPTLTPRSQQLRHTFSTLSLSLPVPEPPAINGEVQLNSSLTDLEMDNREPVQSLEGDSVTSDSHEPLSLTSSIFSDDSAPLFEPSSPHRMIPTDFILTDIKEESEDVLSTATSEATENDSLQGEGNHKNISLAETNFNEASYSNKTFQSGGALPETLQTGTMSENSEQFDDSEASITASPFLPVSPPPGPLLSPRYSMLLATLEESKQTPIHESPSPSWMNRLSAHSTVDDEPPPLPQSLPPGKTISPRHSIILSHDKESAELDLSDLLSRLASLYEGKRIPVAQNSKSGSSPSVILEQPQEDSASTSDRELERESFPPSPVPEMGDYTDGALESEENVPQLAGSPIIEPPEEFTERTLEYADSALAPHKKDSVTSESSSYGKEQNDSDVNSSTAQNTADSIKSQHQNLNRDFSGHNLPISLKSPELLCRKAGWLEAKHVLVCKNKKGGNAIKIKGKWRKYWVMLKQLSLLLYHCEEEHSLENAKISFTINLNLCLASSVHDHMRRDNIFSVAAANGSVYYFQARSQGEVSGWMTAVHCAAAVSVSGKMDRQESIGNLECKVSDLCSTIEKLKQLRKKAEAAFYSTSNQLEENHQLLVYSDAIELLSVDVYRLRCYIASLRATEQPNPEIVMSCVTRQTKQELMKTGLFSVSTITALINSKQGLLLSSEVVQAAEVETFRPKTKTTLAGQGSQRSLRSRKISDPLPIIKPKLISFSNISDSSERKVYPEDSTNLTEDGSTTVSVGVSSGENTWFIRENDRTVDEVHVYEKPKEWDKDRKLQKSVMDLCETEAEYIKSLEMLVDDYLQPLQIGSIISKDEAQVLCGDVIPIVRAQQELFSQLKELVSCLESPKISQQTALKNMVKQIAEVFLSKEDHFRRYSAFCASRQKAKELTSQVEAHQLNVFLEAANPHHDLLRSLSSLLTKPIVRISRYPLFLSSIQENSDDESEGKGTMSEAIKVMSTVANHINEMQRVCETYQSLFESVMSSSTSEETQVRISISELKYHGEAKWLNPTAENLRKGLRKGEGPLLTVFVFDSAIVLLYSEKRLGLKGKEKLTEEDVTYKALLPCVYCLLQDLPNSDGVSNMWQIHFMPQSGHTGCNYLFRNERSEDKQTLFGWIKHVTEAQSISTSLF